MERLSGLAPGDVHAFVGPHIRAAHYEFGSEELGEVATVAGEGVRSHTVDGVPALDMTEAIRFVLEHAGVASVDVLDADTAEPGWFSHRTRADPERQVTTATLERIDD